MSKRDKMWPTEVPFDEAPQWAQEIILQRENSMSSTPRPAFSVKNPSDRLAAQTAFGTEVRQVYNQTMGIPAAAQAPLDLSQLLNFVAPIENMLEAKGLAFIKTNIVPTLTQRLDDVKAKFGFDLVIARALLDGLKNAPDSSPAS